MQTGETDSKPLFMAEIISIFILVSNHTSSQFSLTQGPTWALSKFEDILARYKNEY